MRTLVRPFAPALAVVMSAACAGAVHAQCAVTLPQLQKQSWQEYGTPDAGRFVRVADIGTDHERDRGNERTEAIVGFWRVIFTSYGSAGIPDGTVIDKAFAQWHSDGTEFTNSLRPPVTSSFCLGTWKKTGASTYSLNHFAIGWDTSSNFIGLGNIRETVTVSRDRASFTGRFTVDQYDPAGNRLSHAQGSLKGQRINLGTRVQDLI